MYGTQIVSVLLRRTFYKMLIKRPIFYACLFISDLEMFYCERKSPGDRETKKKIKLLNSGARSGSPWVRKFGYPREILVVRWLYVHPPVCPHHTFLHCVEPATCVWLNDRLPYHGRLGHSNNNKLKPFSRLNFCVYADMDKRERARARDKKKSKAETNFTKHENFKAVVKKW